MITEDTTNLLFVEELPAGNISTISQQSLRYYLEELQILRDALSVGQAPDAPVTDACVIKKRAEIIGIRPPKEQLGALEATEWHYWIDIVTILQTQARAARLGVPVTSGNAEYDRLLADMHDRLADLLRGLLQGNTPELFQQLRHRAKPPRTPRHVDSVTEAAAAALVLAEMGRFDSLPKAEAWAAERFGVRQDTFAKAVSPDLLQRRVVHLHDRLHRRVPRENWQAFLEGVIKKAAGKYREENPQNTTSGK